jgi:hypothetical protein
MHVQIKLKQFQRIVEAKLDAIATRHRGKNTTFKGVVNDWKKHKTKRNQ